MWEMAEAEPPFAAETQQISDRWPPLSEPRLYSPAFHEFLRQCSQPASSRPTAGDLKKVYIFPKILERVAHCLSDSIY